MDKVSEHNNYPRYDFKLVKICLDSSAAVQQIKRQTLCQSMTRRKIEKNQHDMWRNGIFACEGTNEERANYGILFSDGKLVETYKPFLPATMLSDYIAMKAHSLDGHGVSNITLNKMMQSIQLVYCSMTGSLLISGASSASPHGPVFDSVYHRYSVWGGMGIHDVRGNTIDDYWVNVGCDNLNIRSWIDSAIESLLQKSPHDYSSILMNDSSPYRFAFENSHDDKPIAHGVNGWNTVPSEWIIHQAIAINSPYYRVIGWNPEHAKICLE